jgi:hypothetical protein
MIDTQKEDWAATALKSTFFGEPLESLTRVELLAVIGHLIQERANDAKRYKSSMEIASLARLRLTDDEVDLLRLLCRKTADPLAAYVVTLSQKERKTLRDLLARLGGER